MEIQIGRFRWSSLQVWWEKEKSNSRSCYSNTFYASSNLDISISWYFGLYLIALSFLYHMIWTFGWHFCSSWRGQQRRGVRSERCYWNLCQGQGLWLSNLIAQTLKSMFSTTWSGSGALSRLGDVEKKKMMSQCFCLSLLWKSCRNTTNQE